MFDDQADALWERSRDAFEFAVVRDREYLNWRYCDPRAGIYRVRIAEHDGELMGFTVTAAGGQHVQLVDVLAIPGDERVLRGLIEDAAGSARDEGKTALSLLMPRVHPYRETLRRFGFLGSKSETNMGYRHRNDSILDFLNQHRSARLHVAYGDTDHI